MRTIFYTILLLPVLIAFGCVKEKTIRSKDALIRVSESAISFDTIFTINGSVTKSFKIYNENAQKLVISSIQLLGAQKKVFSININGEANFIAKNIEIPAYDSIYIFVQARINQSNTIAPFNNTDSIAIRYNGNEIFVPLSAWGQNARYINGKTIAQDEVWDSSLPYYIEEHLIVAKNKKLTIEKGTKIYVHPNAAIIIEGSLHINGTPDNRVIFQGNRLDEPYTSYPGAWSGIIFTDNSVNNYINYALLQNAYQAIIITGLSRNDKPKLNINETIIQNSFDAGIIAIEGEINARNLLISNCRRNIILQGGKYNFSHCTIATIYNEYISELIPNPVLQISDQPAPHEDSPVEASFTNCIFWGEKGSLIENEVWVERKGKKPFIVKFEQPLWKQKNNPAQCQVLNPIANALPLFDTIDIRFHKYNFRLKEGSPAINKARPTPTTIDLDGTPRPKSGLPDIGCYESH